MSIDRREDAGEFYPGGKVISTRPVATDGDVKHSDFAGLDVKTNTIPDLREAVRELGRRLGATVVTALSACVAVAATVQTVSINDLDFDANPSIVTSVVFDAPPDFSTNNTALVETIEATAPAPGDYATVSNRAMHAVQTETDPVWDREKGDYATIQALENGDIIVSQANAADHAVYADHASFATDANYAETANSAGYAETADAAEPGGELDTQLTSLSSRVSLASSSATNYTDSATNAIAARIATLTTNVYTKAETDAAISPTSPAFSNAVLSVGLGIDTDTVAIINELVDSAHDLPVTGATSVGALLLALAAAVAALKKRLSYALVAKTIENGAVALDDRASNAVDISATLSPNTLTVNFPAATSGKVRDFALRLNIASGVTAPELVLPQGVVCENADGEVPEISDGGTGGTSTILYFSETENNGTTAKFLLKGETLAAITQA